jgi:hypothetical protein
MTVPYERAIALYLIRRCGRDEGLTLVSATLYYPDCSPEPVTLFKSSSNGPVTASDATVSTQLLNSYTADAARVFKKYDILKKGVLDRVSVARALAEAEGFLHMDVELQQIEVDMLIMRYDLKNRGAIELTEFCQFVTQKHAVAEVAARKVLYYTVQTTLSCECRPVVVRLLVFVLAVITVS